MTKISSLDLMRSIADLNLADRANLYFKIGNFVDISFTDDEQVIIDKINDM